MAIGRITGQMLSSQLNRDTTDLKFSTTGETNLLVLDATNDRIGVGVASPTVQFETSGSALIGTDLTVTGNLTVNGSTTTINTTNLTVDDKNIELAHSLSGQSPTDAAADGGGIILKGDTDHTILWSNSNNSWDFSEHVSVATGSAFQINNSTVLDANNLTLENIQIAGNVITSSSNADISLQPSGTGKVVIEGIQIDGTVITGVDSTVISFGGNTISGIASPSGSSDAATKGYVDSQVSAISSTLGFSDSSSNTGSVVVGTNDLEFRSGDSLTLTVAGNGVTASLNDNITVNQIGAKDSTAVSITSPLQVTGALQTSSSLQIAGSTVITAILDEDNMVSDSASAIPTQQSVKAYVDSQITATNSLTLGDDASSEITLNLDDVLNVKGGNSVTSSVAGDSLTFGLDANITVNQIGALDSTAVSITSPLQATSIQTSGNVDVNGSATIGSVQISGNVITSTDSTQLNFGQMQLTDVADPTQASDVATKSYVDSQTSSIVTTIGISDSASNSSTLTLGVNDLEFRTGDSITPTVAGTGVTFNLNDNITVNQIGAKDSSAVSITSATQIDGTLQVSGASTLVGNVSSSGSITAGTSFIIGGADLNETDLEKLDGITDGTAAANKALVLDGSSNISGIATLTATTGDFQTVKVNTIESDDSTAVTVNDGLQVNGNFGFNEGVTVTQILDEDNFASNSATALATQQSIKAYVDAVAEGLHVHAPAKAATTDSLTNLTSDTVTYNNGSSGVGATLTLSTALTTLDGYSLQNGDRIIVKNESNQAHNGVYTWATGGTVLTRATDMDTPVEAAGGDFMFVQEGTLFGDAGFVQTETVTTIGSDNFIFVQFSGAGQIVAGDGLAKSGNELSVNVDNSTIEINADTLRVKDAGITNAKLANSTVTLVGDDSTGTAVSLGETFKIAGGDSINSTVSADTLTVHLDDNITVNQIGAKDSTAVSITSPLQTTTIQSSGNVDVNGTFTIGTGSGVTTILDEDNMASNSATALATQQSIKAYVDSVSGGTITLGDSASNSGSVNVNGAEELTFRSGDSITMTVSGNGVTSSLNDNITVNQIGAKDSTAVSITSPLQVTGAVQTDTSLQIAGSTTITAILDEDTLSSNSDTALATQQSIKAYVDAQITATNSLTLGDDASSEITLNLDDVLNVKGGNSITSSVAGDSLTFALDSNITVNQIGALDSTAINITSPVYVSGALNTDTSLQIAGSTLIDGILDEDNMASNSATKLATQQSIKAYVDSVAGGTITLGDSASNAGSVNINSGQDLEFRSGDSITMTVSGNGVTTALNDNITVNQIGAKDSTAISLTSNTQVDGTLQVSGTSALVGNVTMSGTFTAATGSSVGNLTLANGSITDSSGAISFGDENLTTTGTITAGNIQVDNLTVSGTTTSVNSTNITVSDPMLILSETNSGGADVDSGIMIERGSAGNNAVFYWNEGDDRFKAVLSTSDGTTTSVTDSSFATVNLGGLVFGAESVVASSILDEDNMASDSATALATQQSIKAYVDTSIGAISSTLGFSDSSSNTGSVVVGTNDIEFRSGESITTAVAGNGVTFNLNDNITVNQIGAKDSTAINITSPVYVTGALNTDTSLQIAGSTLIDGILDEDNMASNSATKLATQQSIKAYVDSVAGGTITLGDSASNAGSVNINAGQDLEFRSGDSITMTVSGNGVTTALNDNITVNQIGAKDSTAISLTSNTQVDGTLQVSGTSALVGNVTMSGTFSAATGSTVGNLTLADGSITDSSGTISFDNENLTTTGTITAGNIQVDNLTVSGTTTNVNTTNITVSDPLIILSETNSGGADVDSGILVERGSAGNNAAWYWNEGDDRWKAVLTTSEGTATSVTDSSYATVNIGGLVMGAESVVITSILDEDNMASNSATALATQQSIKAYVDSVAGGTITLGDSASNSGSVNINGNQDLEFRSGDSITMTVSGNGVTAALNDNITVNQIGAKDSTAITIENDTYINGNLWANGLAVATIGSRDSVGIDFLGTRLQNINDPVADFDAATKNYVDVNTPNSINDLSDVDADGASALPGDVLISSAGDSTVTVLTLSHNLTGAMRLPAGNTSERPSIYSGIIRYNTETGKYEGSTDGSTWNAFAMEGTAETLNKDVFTGDGGATYNFVNVTTPLAGSGSNGATGLIVYIDNVLQEPTQNYTITNTAITFDSVVHSGARIVVIQGFDGGAGGGAAAGLTTTENTDVDSATETLDTWALATYRAAKYTYRIENADTSEYQAGEILVVHDGSSAYFTEYAKVLTGNNDLITFSVGVGGGNVILNGSANTPNSNFRAKRINLEVA